MLRLAIISTPRSGNTWLRRLLVTLYDLKDQNAYTPEGVDWAHLPERFALQIHWHPEPDFLALLEQHQFHKLVIARHPFDILISLLNYYYYHHDRSRCAEGSSCYVCPVVGAAPRSAEFLDGFACGFGARDLFAYTQSWWGRPDVISLRYEDLVDDTAGQLARVIAALGQEPSNGLDQAIAANTMGKLRAQFRDNYYHFWQGRPGLWKSLFPAEAARRIAEVHPWWFETLGYACDPDEALEPAQADANWLRLQVAMRDWSLHETREHLTWAQQALRAEQARTAELQAALDAAQAALGEARARLEGSAASPPEATARRPHLLHRRYPRLSATLDRLAGRSRGPA